MIKKILFPLLFVVGCANNPISNVTMPVGAGSSVVYDVFPCDYEGDLVLDAGVNRYSKIKGSYLHNDMWIPLVIYFEPVSGRITIKDIPECAEFKLCFK